MINHVAYEVDGKVLENEVAFWQCFGWTEVMIRSRTAPKSRWLRAPIGDTAIFIHLLPVDGVEVSGPGGLHVCVIASARVNGYDGVMAAIDELEFVVEVSEPGSIEKWWGARRSFIESPAGLEVELLEHAPPAGRPLPPETD